MPTGAKNVRSWGQTGSDPPTLKMTLLTRTGPRQVVGLNANLLALSCLILTFGSLRSGCMTFAARSSCAAKHVASRLPERQCGCRARAAAPTTCGIYGEAQCRDLVL